MRGFPNASSADHDNTKKNSADVRQLDFAMVNYPVFFHSWNHPAFDQEVHFGTASSTVEF